MKSRFQFLLPLCFLLVASARLAQADTVTRLRCEQVNNPFGVEVAHPRLSWITDSNARGWRQSAYRVLVASSPALLAQNKGDLWDSGIVKSSGSLEVLYKGKPLGSRARCFWKVRVWDNKAKALAYSAPAKWEMGLLQKSDWHGQWIGYTPPQKPQAEVPTLQNASWIWYPEGDPLHNAPEATRYFRRTVTLPTGSTVQKAQLRIAADNTATVYVNGHEVGHSHDSWKTRDVFEVGHYLTAGNNVIAVAITNEGTAAGLAVQMDAIADGVPLTIVTDGTWKTSQDAPTGWQNVAFDDGAWTSSRVVAKVGEGPWGNINNTENVPAPPAPHLWQTFQVNGPIKRATAYICGLGYNEMYLNGRKVDDHMLDPGWTRYDRRSLYVTHDITAYLKRGENALGVVLGTGHYDDHVLAVWDFDMASWRTPPKMLVEVRVYYADGHSQIIKSDASWKAATGPTTFDSISAGETYDARLEKTGWDTSGYNDSAWHEAQVVEPVKGVLSAQIAPPIRVVQSIAPVKVTQPKPGVWLFDLGQNIAGIPQLRVSGPAGTKVVMQCAEKLHADGTLDASNIDYFVHRRDPAEPFQTDTYILKGGGREVWNPRFTYHGFQYVQVTGFPGTPTADNLRGLSMHTDFAPAGRFECSNPLLNKIQQMCLWSYRNNFHSIPTDCPHREKNGWTGDAQLAAEMGLYNFDGTANYEKWLSDIADEQGDKGDFAGIIPTSGWGYNIGPSWDSAYPLITWYLYQYKGDKSVVEKHYPRLVRYVDYVTTRAKDGIVDYGLDDWVAPKTKTPAALTSTAYYYADTLIVARMAQLLGKTSDAKKYFEHASAIKAAFNTKFYNSQSGQYANGSLTALSCALYQGLVEPQNKARVLANLVAEVKKQDYHMDVGILGAKYLLNTLADSGYADVAYRMLEQRTMPSYGYWVDQGASTLWEDWDGHESLNHVMFGDVSAWFYKYLAGINAAAPGFTQIVIKPHIVGDLKWAYGSYDSAQGRIVSRWSKSGSTLQLDVTIPANSSATVYVPAKGGAKITEGGQPIAKAQGVKLMRRDGEYAVFRVGAGTYRFGA